MDQVYAWLFPLIILVLVLALCHWPSARYRWLDGRHDAIMIGHNTNKNEPIDGLVMPCHSSTSCRSVSLAMALQYFSSAMLGPLRRTNKEQGKAKPRRGHLHRQTPQQSLPRCFGDGCTRNRAPCHGVTNSIVDRSSRRWQTMTARRNLESWLEKMRKSQHLWGSEVGTRGAAIWAPSSRWERRGWKLTAKRKNGTCAGWELGGEVGREGWQRLGMIRCLGVRGHAICFYFIPAPWRSQTEIEQAVSRAHISIVGRDENESNTDRYH